MFACSHCAKLWKGVEAGERCGCCGAMLHIRKPDSVRRTWAFLIAACILYFPANILPVTVTTSFPGGEQQDTIMSGIIYFWVSGSWVVGRYHFYRQLCGAVVQAGGHDVAVDNRATAKSLATPAADKTSPRGRSNRSMVDAGRFRRIVIDGSCTAPRLCRGPSGAGDRSVRGSSDTDHACFNEL